jgi:hypothetical protein
MADSLVAPGLGEFLHQIRSHHNCVGCAVLIVGAGIATYSDGIVTGNEPKLYIWQTEMVAGRPSEIDYREGGNPGIENEVVV